MIIGENKHLSFSGKAAKGRCVQDAVTIAFETSAVWICIFRDGSVARTNCMCSEWGKSPSKGSFAC
jgi:hypothetical protein